MSKPRLSYNFMGEEVTNNNALSSKASEGANTASMTQSTSGNQPQSKSKTGVSSTLIPALNSACAMAQIL